MHFLLFIAFLCFHFQETLAATSDEPQFTLERLKTLPIMNQAWGKPPFRIKKDEEDEGRLRISATSKNSKNAVSIGEKNYTLLYLSVTLRRKSFGRSLFDTYDEESTVDDFLADKGVKILRPCSLVTFPIPVHSGNMLFFYQFFEKSQESYTITFTEQTTSTDSQSTP